MLINTHFRHTDFSYSNNYFSNSVFLKLNILLISKVIIVILHLSQLCTMLVECHTHIISSPLFTFPPHFSDIGFFSRFMLLFHNFTLITALYNAS